MTRFLVIAPHPDDAELGMGGAIVKLVRAGHHVHICDMTDGEPTPRGDHDTRMKEAAAAGKLLGVDRTNLGLTNRQVTHDVASRHKLAALIRARKPDCLFIPYEHDAHPDHRAVTNIAIDARFDAKLTKSDIPGEPHNPRRIIQYYCTHLRASFDPTFCIDVTDEWDVKVASCRAYASQGLADEKGLIEVVDRMHAYFGGRIGVKYAEPFFCREVLGLSGLDQLLCKGR